jgi:hypothetical protein
MENNEDTHPEKATNHEYKCSPSPEASREIDSKSNRAMEHAHEVKRGEDIQGSAHGERGVYIAINRSSRHRRATEPTRSV